MLLGKVRRVSTTSGGHTSARACAELYILVLATGLFSAAVSHTVYGPLRKSWGIEMTLLTAIMRDVYMHTHLADLVRSHFVSGRRTRLHILVRLLLGCS